MPKLRRPDGRVVSVSEKGVPALLARGYEEVTQTRATYEAQAKAIGELVNLSAEALAAAEAGRDRKVDFPFAAGRLAPEGTPSLEWPRRDLNAKAISVGIERPEKLPNKQAVIDAIRGTT